MPRLFSFEGQRTYINQRHEVVAVATGGAIVVGMGPELEHQSQSFKEVKRHKYSEEELEKIAKAYDEEYRRGADTLFWEGVVEGEELPTIVKGPITLMDSVAFYHAIGYTTAFKVTHEIFKENPGMVFRDPETNAPIGAGLIHASDNAARVQGVPYALTFAAQSEGNIAHLICNWMGDDGFLKKLECRQRRINIVGNTNWLKGNVVRKYIENGEYLVDLELTIHDQNNILIMQATARVSLLSRTDF